MANEALMTYQQVIESLQKKKRQKHLLLGNGFSMSYDSGIFSYNALSDFLDANGDLTIDEVFEAITLIQTKKIGKFPIILVGTDFWSGLIDWIEKVVLEKYSNISPNDMKLIKLVDTADEVVDIVDEFYKKYNLTPNF